MSLVYAGGVSHRSYFLQTLGADSHLFPLDWPETIHWAVDHNAENVFKLLIVSCLVGYGWAVVVGILDKMRAPLQQPKKSRFMRWTEGIFLTGNARSITIATTSIAFVMLVPIQIKQIMMDSAKVAGMQEATKLLATLDMKLQQPSVRSPQPLVSIELGGGAEGVPKFSGYQLECSVRYCLIYAIDLRHTLTIPLKDIRSITQITLPSRLH